MSAFEKIKEDLSFLDDITLWDVVKGVLTVALIYGLIYTCWQYQHAQQEEQRIAEVGMAITALVADGYDVYLEGSKVLFVPDIENYNVDFDTSTRRINLTRRVLNEKQMFLHMFGLDGEKTGLFSALK